MWGLGLGLGLDLELGIAEKDAFNDNDVKTFPKLQREWSRAVSVAAVKRLAPVEMALGDADFIHPEARARPVVAILTAKLSNEFFRLSPRDFVAYGFASNSVSHRSPT